MTIGFYQVQSGDQLYQILRSHYGSAGFLRDRAAVTRLVVENNPQISDIDRIYPNQIIVLPPLAGGGISSPILPKTVPPALPPQALQSCQMLSSRLARLTPGERDILGCLNLVDAYKSAGETFIAFAEEATKAAIQPTKAIVLEYLRKESGTLTKGQYDYRRGVKIKSIKASLGPLHQLINPGRQVGEVMRVEPRAINRVGSLLGEAEQLARISKLAKTGGVVLAVADLGITGFQIATADNDRQRTSLAIEATGRLAGQAAFVGVTMLVMATPAGWVGLLVVAAVGAVGSGLAAEAGGAAANAIAANTLYDKNGERVDVAVDHFWKHLNLSR